MYSNIPRDCAIISLVNRIEQSKNCLDLEIEDVYKKHGRMNITAKLLLLETHIRVISRFLFTQI